MFITCIHNSVLKKKKKARKEGREKTSRFNPSL